MNNKFIKGTKRKCGSCQTLFYDFDKTPIVCPNCGADVAMLTNVSKRGRPPKVNKESKENKLVDSKKVDEDPDDIELLNDDKVLSESDDSIIIDDESSEIQDDDSEEVEKIIDIKHDDET